MAELPPSEVKGAWFCSALDYARELHGDAQVDEWVAHSHPAYREVYANPIASAWYPEACFQEALSMLYERVAQENDRVFEKLIEGCTERGVNLLFRMLIRVSAPAFVLRRLPTMWRQIRRGAGHVDVMQEAGHSMVHYSEFPWFKDPLYRLLTVGSLRALVRTCTQESPRIEVLDYGVDQLSLRIAYRAQEAFPPPTRHVSTRPPQAGSRFPADLRSGEIPVIQVPAYSASEPMPQQQVVTRTRLLPGPPATAARKGGRRA